MALKFGSLFYRCNVCGSSCVTPVSEMTRETPTCSICGSTPRYRALVAALSRELFGKSIALPEFPVAKQVRGIGMTDWDRYAAELGKKFDYTNTYYHKAPQLDIKDIDPKMAGTLDFISSTEVFEHVTPPVSVAFRNARRLLKDDGVLIMTVPYSNDANTVEHFPALHDFSIEKRGDRQVLVNTTADGKQETYENLVFHGGQGFALEMRLFSEHDLLKELHDAGFVQAEVIRSGDYEYGAFWPQPWSLPIVARAAKRRTPIPVELPSSIAADAPNIAADDVGTLQKQIEVCRAENEILRQSNETMAAHLSKIGTTRAWRFVNAYWRASAKLRSIIGRH